MVLFIQALDPNSPHRRLQRGPPRCPDTNLDLRLEQKTVREDLDVGGEGSRGSTSGFTRRGFFLLFLLLCIYFSRCILSRHLDAL